MVEEFAYVDFDIPTEGEPIAMRVVPLFVLPGPIGDVLLGKSEQEALGITSTKRYVATASRQLKEGVMARGPFDINGKLIAAAGPPVQKLMRLTLVGTSLQDEIYDDSTEAENPIRTKSTIVV